MSRPVLSDVAIGVQATLRAQPPAEIGDSDGDGVCGHGGDDEGERFDDFARQERWPATPTRRPR